MEWKVCGVSRRFLRQGHGTNVFYAVKDADLSLAEGRITVLSGHSGSGKSTLLHMIAGLLEPSEGKVFWEDTDIYQLDDGERSALRRKTTGLIPQGQTAVPSLTILENVLLPAALLSGGSAPEECRRYALELMQRAGMDGLAAVMPQELSGGELRRMAVVRALVLRPGLILADEPTGDLDPENAAVVLDLLKKARDEGGSVLLVTHDRLPEGYGDEKYEMDHGKLVRIQ